MKLHRIPLVALFALCLIVAPPARANPDASSKDALAKQTISVRPAAFAPEDLRLDGARSISFVLASPSFVTLEISTPDGKRVATLLSGYFPAGNHFRALDAGRLADGLYFYQFRAGGAVETRRVMVAR